jgi:transposase
MIFPSAARRGARAALRSSVWGDRAVAARVPFQLNPEDRPQVQELRFQHPDPHCQQRCWLLWLLEHDLTNAQAEDLVGVSRTTAWRWRQTYQAEGLSGLLTRAVPERTGALLPQAATLAEDFRHQPPHTVAEAAARIEQRTGLRRGRTQVRQFLRHTLGLRWRRAAAVPCPPKQTLAEHVQTQAVFRDNQLEPVLAAARAGQGHVFFVDAAHFVLGSFLCCLWSAARVFLKAASGRQRYNVLGAWNAVTHTLTAVTNTSYVNATTVCDLLHQIAAQGLVGPLTLVLDNARYQRCHVVQDLAAQLGIRLLFLPSYSPNLNLIERLWKFVRSEALNGHYHTDFAAFRAAIDQCLAEIDTKHRDSLQTLMTHEFQTFENVSILAA